VEWEFTKLKESCGRLFQVLELFGEKIHRGGGIGGNLKESRTFTARGAKFATE
jgi:hypothetical protein